MLVPARRLHRSPRRGTLPQRTRTYRRPPEADLVSQSSAEPLTTWDLVDVPESLVFAEDEPPTWLEIEIGRALPRRRRGGRSRGPSSEGPIWNPPMTVSPVLQIRTRDGYAVATRDLGNGVFIVAPAPNSALDPAVSGVVGNALVNSIIKSLQPLIEAAAVAAQRKKAAKEAQAQIPASAPAPSPPPGLAVRGFGCGGGACRCGR